LAVFGCQSRGDGVKLSIYPVLNKLHRAIELALKQYPESFPTTGGPWTVIEQEEYDTPELRAGIEQTWDIFFFNPRQGGVLQDHGES
jgi:hypothetical protein